MFWLTLYSSLKYLKETNNSIAFPPKAPHRRMLCDCRSGVLWYWSLILSGVLKKLLNVDLFDGSVNGLFPTWKMRLCSCKRNTQERRFGWICDLKSTRRFTLLGSFFIPRDKRTWKLSSCYLPSLPETTGLDNTTVCLCSYSPGWYPGKSQPFHMPSSKG